MAEAPECLTIMDYRAAHSGFRSNIVDHCQTVFLNFISDIKLW